MPVEHGDNPKDFIVWKLLLPSRRDSIAVKLLDSVWKERNDWRLLISSEWIWGRELLPRERLKRSHEMERE